jgi:hypothetical protein
MQASILLLEDTAAGTEAFLVIATVSGCVNRITHHERLRCWLNSSQQVSIGSSGHRVEGLRGVPEPTTAYPEAQARAVIKKREQAGQLVLDFEVVQRRDYAGYWKMY